MREAIKGGVILFPILIILMIVSVVVSTVQAAIAEIEHWLPEFKTVWMFITKDL